MIGIEYHTVNLEGSKNPLVLNCWLCFNPFYAVDERLARLSGLGAQFEAFSPTVDCEAFRPDQNRALA